MKQLGSDCDSIRMVRGKEAGGEDELVERQNSSLRLWYWVLVPGALLFLIVGAVYAFTATFGQFRNYDDEGRLMISVQGYLEGNPLYDRVNSHYGPVYYFYEWAMHKLAAIPLTSDATAGLCVAHWILGATILALAGFCMTRSTLLAAFIFMQAVVHLTPLDNEPGHPQELVVMMLCIAGLVAVGGLKRRQTLPLLAAIGTGLLFTKINVGGFFGLALALAMLCCTSGAGFVRVGVWVVTLLSATIPILLMWSHYGQEWARNYSLEMTLSILAVGLVANTFVTERAIRPREWVRTATTSIIISGVILFVLLATGSTLSAIWQSLVTGASKIGGIFYIPLHLESLSWSAWAALMAAALAACLKRRQAAMLVPLSLIKFVYGVTGTLVLVFEPASQLGCLLPWAWLLVVGTKEMDSDSFPRIFLSFLAVWQGLQAYPVGGTQVSVGTFMGVLVYSVCLWDAIRVFAGTSFLHLPLQRMASMGGGRLAQIGVFLALLTVFSMKWCEPMLKWREYEAKQPLDLPGCHYRRIAPANAIQYRKLAEFLETRSDTFFIFPGLNSMYFWTDKKPPTYFNVGGEGIMPTEPQQVEVVEALERAKRSLVVLREMDWPFGRAHGELKAGPLADFVRNGCYQIAAFAQFKILAPRQSYKTPD